MMWAFSFCFNLRILTLDKRGVMVLYCTSQIVRKCAQGIGLRSTAFADRTEPGSYRGLVCAHPLANEKAL